MKTKNILLIALIFLILCNNRVISGNCSIKYEPEVLENAKKTIELNDVSYALKLVKPGDKKEITDAYNLVMKVRELSPEAKVISEKFFLETLARVHQSYDRSFPWMLSGLFFITSVLFAIFYFRKK
jgi:hypothetical protein